MRKHILAIKTTVKHGFPTKGKIKKQREQRRFTYIIYIIHTFKKYGMYLIKYSYNF